MALFKLYIVLTLLSRGCSAAGCASDDSSTGCAKDECQGGRCRVDMPADEVALLQVRKEDQDEATEATAPQNENAPARPTPEKNAPQTPQKNAPARPQTPVRPAPEANTLTAKADAEAKEKRIKKKREERDKDRNNARALLGYGKVKTKEENAGKTIKQEGKTLTIKQEAEAERAEKAEAEKKAAEDKDNVRPFAPDDGQSLEAQLKAAEQNQSPPETIKRLKREIESASSTHARQAGIQAKTVTESGGRVAKPEMATPGVAKVRKSWVLVFDPDTHTDRTPYVLGRAVPPNKDTYRDYVLYAQISQTGGGNHGGISGGAYFYGDLQYKDSGIQEYTVQYYDGSVGPDGSDTLGPAVSHDAMKMLLSPNKKKVMSVFCQSRTYAKSGPAKSDGWYDQITGNEWYDQMRETVWMKRP